MTASVVFPQLYHREDARSNSLPLEVLHSSVYQPPLRERFNSLDSNYCSGAEHRTGLHRVGGSLRSRDHILASDWLDNRHVV